jgi:hypothetical protein
MLTGASEFFDQRQKGENEAALRTLRNATECRRRGARPSHSGMGSESACPDAAECAVQAQHRVVSNSVSGR